MGVRRRVADEGGFTILESVIALSLIFSVLVVLLGGLTTGVRGVVIGRQRGVALALANEILEDARARAYGEVGHDFDSDPTLATDPLITGTSPNLVYNGVTPPEPLAGSSVDAGAAGGTNTNPLFPFSPHTYTQQRDGSKYTTSVYVTTVTPASGDPFKRISVTVSWRPGLSSAGRTLSLSSFLYNTVAPPDPRLIGHGGAVAGPVVLSASLGSGTAQAQATGRSCWACQAAGTPKVGDDDLLPYFYGNATGPANLSENFSFASGLLGLPGVLSGSLLSVGTACGVSCATVTIDRDTTAGNPTISSTASVSYPAVKLMTFNAGLLLPAGFTAGMVSIGTGTATATAAAGSGTAAPTVTGTNVAVQVYNAAAHNYHTYNVTPGGAMIDAATGLAVAADPTSTLVFSPFLLGGVTVTMNATVHASQKVVSSSGPVSG